MSYAPVRSRVGGNRTHTVRIKSPPCCQLHHDPAIGRAYAFEARRQHRVLLSRYRFSVVALRIELSATRLSAVSGQPALDYRAVEVGTVGLEPTISCFQNTRACRYPTSRCSVRTAGFEPAISWPPTRRDNQASLRSVSSTPWGSRTQALPRFVIPAPVHRTGRVVRIV